jgi:hypothetical protein
MFWVGLLPQMEIRLHIVCAGAPRQFLSHA